MRLPTIQGVYSQAQPRQLSHRPQIMQRHLPSRYQAQVHDGFAVAGICLIRLEHIRPKLMPGIIGSVAKTPHIVWPSNGTMVESFARESSSRAGIQTHNSITSWATHFPRRAPLCVVQCCGIPLRDKAHNEVYRHNGSRRDRGGDSGELPRPPSFHLSGSVVLF
jgi:hypothetical protein